MPPATHPSAPSRPWLTVAACTASALLAFGLGRITAPGHGPAKNPVTTSRLTANTTHPARNTAAKRAAARLASSGNAAEADTSTTPVDEAAKKEAEIIALLTQFKTNTRTELGPELLGLVAWVNAADLDDLDLFTALGKEIVSDKNMAHGLILPLAFTRWTDLDAPDAFAAYLALPEEERTSDIAKIVFGGWMRKGSPREAIDHALALQRTAGENDTLGQGFVGGLLADLFRTDRVQAGAMASEFARSEDPVERQAAERAADDMMRELADTEGPAAALAWINQWPLPDARAELRSGLLERLLNGDEAQRAAGMELFAKSPNPDTSTVLSIARQKASASVPEAQTWLMTLPPGETRSAALDGVLEAMENHDKLPDIAPWLATKPPHPDFDSAYSRLAMAKFQQREDFPAALELARRVVDPAHATQLKSQMIARWLEFDPERAVTILGPQLEKAMLAPKP